MANEYDDIKLRRGTAAQWQSNNTVLGPGEPGLETDTGRLKHGNGTDPWNSLPYMDQDIADMVGITQVDMPTQRNSPVTSFRDTLVASAIVAGGGRFEVMYDDQGYPSVMVRIPKFMREDIHADFGTGVHPAFIVNGVEKSEIWIGMHQARVYNSRALSLPGLDPTVSVDWDQANAYCTNKGAGWHLMTNWEWAAVSLWVLKQVADGSLAHQPRGNTDYGRAHDELQETGTLRNNGDLGSTGDRILTGSGPLTWRHDLSIAGIADLVGNVWEWVGGLKLVDGSIHMPVDNYYGQSDASWGDSGKDIKSGGYHVWKTATDIFASGTYNAGYDDALMRSALLLPANVSDQSNGSYYTNISGERVPRRGGYWFIGSDAGLGALSLTTGRSTSAAGIGFRPAFVA